MSRRRKIAIAIGSALLIGLLFTAFILPPIIRSQLETQIARATDRQCTVAGVSINPLTWTVEVRGARLAEKGAGAVFVSFSSLRLRVSPTSIWRLAPVVAELEVTSPYIHLQRNAANSYNFSDILAKNASKPKKPAEKPAKFSLNNIVIANGTLTFDDLAVAKPARHNIERLTLQIPFISNISYFAGKYVDPKLSAQVNGAPFNFTGKLKPFEKGLEATLNLHLQQVDLPYYAPYFPEELPVQLSRGTLSTSLTISHQLVRTGKPDINISGTAAIRGLDIREKTGAQLFSLGAVACDIKQLKLLSQQYEFNSITIGAPHLYLHGNKEGVWNLARLAGGKPASSEAAKASPADKKAVKPAVYIKSLQLTDGALSLKDDKPPQGYAAEIGQLTFKLDNFATKGELPAPYSLSLATARKETATINGNIALEPLAVSARLAVVDVVAEATYPYLASYLTEPVSGRVDFRGDLAYSVAKGLTMEQALLRLRSVKAPFGKKDGAQLPLLLAEGGAFNLKERTAAIASITVSGGSISLSRDPAGKLSTALLLREKEPATTAPAAPARKAERKDEPKPFSWKIGTTAVNGLKLTYTDAMKDDARFVFPSITARLSALSGPQMGEMPLDLNIAYGAKGSLAAKGRLKGSPFGFRGDINANNFTFVDFDPYLPEGVNVYLLTGKLDTRLSLELLLKENKLLGSFRGEGAIRDFYSVDAEEEEDLLKWESLRFENFSGTFEPFSLQMSGLSLSNYYARLYVAKNGRLNFQEIYQPPAKKAAAGQPAVQPVAAPAATGSRRDIRIDNITLSDGTLHFSDYHLNRDFDTTMLHLGGRISGLTSAADSAADIDLRGNLENHSPLKIAGKVNPLAGNLFLDMQILFNDIELSPMTPYSGTYLGYAIDKGKLSLALKYKIEQKALTAENKVFLDQFTFGEKIESSKSTSLPVRLAVALLKDRNGEIHLDLPLSGRTDSPQFSIWGLVGQVLKNLLVKAATSPLALLQASLGSSTDFSSIAFASGSSRLSSSEAEKLQALARALTERPGIRLEVTGFADRERDPEGFRNELLLKKMKSEKFLSLAKEKRESGGLSPEAVEIPAAEQSRWLKAVYEKEKFPRPRTALGMLKELPDEEMKKLILANSQISDQQLRGLARERAVAVMNFLLKDGKLPQERFFEKSGDPFAPPTKDVKAGGRVEFGVIAK